MGIKTALRRSASKIKDLGLVRTHWRSYHGVGRKVV